MAANFLERHTNPRQGCPPEAQSKVPKISKGAMFKDSSASFPLNMLVVLDLMLKFPPLLTLQRGPDPDRKACNTHCPGSMLLS